MALVERYREVYNRPELANDPHRGALLWDSTGRSADAAGQNVYKAFFDLVGREPTEQELSQFVPIFQGSYEQGRAALGNYAQLESQRPENLRKKSGEYSAPVGEVFRSMLGRDATAQEIEHFGGLMASGQVDAYTLQDFLRGTPEYQQGEDTKFRGSLSRELEDSDTRAFQKQTGGVIADYANRGIYNSPSLDFALTDLMGKVAEKRQSFLSNLSSQQYGGNKELALGNYRGSMDNYLGEMDYNRRLKQSAYDQNYNRANEIGDYYRQANDYRQSQQGRNVLHGGDWINVGLGVGNTAANVYGNMQKGNFNYLNDRGY